ncbi:morphogenetic protein [Klebsiella quasipneumoniae]|nr:morphogenetic protein [Klebsiella quasipneumoniae]
MIFNAEMVRALLDGRKTQTRRPIKWKQTRFTEIGEREDGSKWPWSEDAEHACDFWHPCPFGAVGDRIWVRETWGVVSHAFSDDGLMIDWVPDRPSTAIHEMPFGNGYYSGYAIYAADGDFTWGDDDGYEDGRSCWKPSIHMPRAASRILLEITDVRVERLRSMSQDDARAEGVIAASGPMEAGLAFRELWDSIYGEESWKANPWVWVIEFKRVEGGTA